MITDEPFRDREHMLNCQTKPRYVLVHATPEMFVFLNLHSDGIGEERYAISRWSFWGVLR